ncbi:MAG: hypothetical protein ABSF54_09865 [Bryobacteraceae bacterium]|jgi:hypothetical protein
MRKTAGMLNRVFLSLTLLLAATTNFAAACGEPSGAPGSTLHCQVTGGCGDDVCQYNVCTCGSCNFCVDSIYNCLVLFDCCTYDCNNQG